MPRAGTRRWAATVALTTLVLAGCGGGEQDRAVTTARTDAAAGPARLQRVVTGLDRPVQAVPVPGSPGRLVVVEQAGRVLTVEDGRIAVRPFMDTADRVSAGGERGLFSLAFHPRFPADPRFYVHFTNLNGDTTVEEHSVEGGRDAGTVRVLLHVLQPFANHNGGALAFGPDGRLYLGLGDGGGGYDPGDRAQNMTSRLGKLLRIDVDRPGSRWQVAAYGLRNPWRFSFDPATGDAWIGDVGQSRWEEIDVLPAGGGLVNFGWDAYEGREAVPAGLASPVRGAGGLAAPVAVYGHDEGCSITGGVVYRGSAVASMQGRYLFGDYCSGTIWTIPADGAAGEPRREAIHARGVVSFDRDAGGEVLVTSDRGEVWRIIPGG